MLKKHLTRLRHWIEKRTGLLWGHTRFESYSLSGYPLHKSWLMICPAYGDYAFSLSVRSRLFFIGRP